MSAPHLGNTAIEKKFVEEGSWSAMIGYAIDGASSLEMVQIQNLGSSQLLDM